MKRLSKTEGRIRRHARIRARIFGTAERPRLHVHRSLRGLYAQLIDDAAGKTIVAVHSKTDTMKHDVSARAGKVAAAYGLGMTLAVKAKDMNITAAVFDRGGYAYHGRVRAVADGARAGGLIL